MGIKMTELFRLYVRSPEGIEGLAEVFEAEGVLVCNPDELELVTSRSVIRDVYFGKDMDGRYTHKGMGLHLIVDGNIDACSDGESVVSYFDLATMNRFVDEIGLGTRRHEKGIADVVNLAGIILDSHYVKHAIYGPVLVALSANPTQRYQCGHESVKR